MKTNNEIAVFNRLCELNPITLFIFTLVFLVIQGNGPNFAQMRKTIRPSLIPLVTKSTDPRHLQFKRGIGLNATNLFTTHKAEFGLGADDQMVNYQSFADDIGFRHYRFQQYYKGVPVESPCGLMTHS